MNVEGMYTILFNKEMERHAAQAPALRERYRKSSIFNIQFPDKSGFTLRYNPSSGISLRAVGSTSRRPLR